MMRRLGLVAAAASVLVGSSLVIAAIPVSQEASLDTSVEYSAGLASVAVVSADVDLDGILDIVVANSETGDVTPLWGVGNGTFDNLGSISTGAGSEPSGVQVADMNGDGIPDIVVSLNSTSEVITYLQDPLGRSFNPAQAVATDFGPVSIAVADFDNDGKNDAVTANQLTLTGTVSFLRGKGDGNFFETVDYSTVGPDGFGGPSSVAAADLNHDSRLDLVVANEDDSNVAVLLGLAGGTFSQPPTTYNVGLAPRSVALGDIDIDGNVDAVTANEDEEEEGVSVLLGDGTGAFVSTTSISIGDATFPEAVNIWDYNLDGRPDIAVAASFLPADGVSILRGSGDGSFTQVPQEFDLAVEDLGPVALAVGDFNGDFKPDLATANINTDDEANAVSVLLSSEDLHLLVGDANTDDVVTEADLGQTTEEIFDGDGSIVIQVAGGKSASGPGADGNGDTFVSAADFVAIVSIIATTSAGS